MDNMRNLRLIVRRDSEKKGDCYVTLRADLVGEGEGMTEIDFFFHRDDFEAFGGRGPFRLRDLWRMAESYGGDDVLFTRMDAVFDHGRRTRGVASVPFYAATIPAFVRRWMLRVVKKVWDHPAFLHADPYQRPKVEIAIPEARRERWGLLYGYGKGECDLEADEETRGLVDALSAEPSFARDMQHLRQIARNSTRGFHQRARLAIFAEHWGGKFSRSFGWIAKTPRGRTIMNGGLIDHGPKSGPAADFAVQLVANPDWSIHT